ncbi:hypothetical protein A9Q84_16680 [Halobacteriovorax marinus]|uniref:Spore coat protein U domain-containing protein n=1 Tax=Halobacteriovorax marinus TaxID=97084 RepID=A0A1Y5F4G2_9BACT|nr:hypothetical protein A9Q84_16680 [Halobacteriovorax marinus]
MKSIITLCFLFSLNSLAVDCSLFVFVNDVYFVQTNSDQSLAVDVDVYRFNNHRKCKKYRLGITTGGSGNYSRKLYNGADSVDYNYHKRENSSSPIKDVLDAQGGQQRVDFKMNGIYKRVTFFARLPDPFSAGNVSTGLYLDTATINIVPRDGGTTGGYSVNISSYLNVQSDVNISLVERGGQFDPNRTAITLDYGLMTTGETRGFDLVVKSNSGYRISVSSENNGVMSHISQANFNVGYSFGVNGSSLSLVGSKLSPIDIFNSSSPSTSTGDVIEIDVSILDTSNKLSGAYSDYIYFTATSTY